MPNTILARQRQLTGTTLEWAANDLILGDGEIAVEHVSSTETKIKIGDGTRPFSALPYSSGGGAGAGSVTKAYVDTQDALAVKLADLVAASAGAASAGKVPQLDGSGRIAVSMLPVSGALIFKGALDVTAAAPAATRADYWIAQADGTAHASFTGIAGGAIKRGDSLLYDGTEWHALAQDVSLAAYLPLSGGTLTGPLLAAPGTLAAPGVAFAGDVGTGMTRVSAGHVAITSAGATVVDVDSTGMEIAGKINPHGGVVGTAKADDAAAGMVGEYIHRSSPPGATPVTTMVGTSVLSMSLPAGDWDVTGVFGVLPNAGTSITSLIGGISTTSGVLATLGDYVEHRMAAVVLGNNNIVHALPVVRFSLAATTTIYVVINATFTAGAMNGGGALRARRVR